jgi:hypothetical protein
MRPVLAVWLHPRRAARTIAEQDDSLALLVRAIARMCEQQPGRSPRPPVLRVVKLLRGGRLAR